MNKRLSTYLDLLRISAASVVLLDHYGRHQFNGELFWRMQALGHYAVVIFFVLSGFVIAYTAEQKEHSLEDFVISRLARLYSVVIPAVLLSFCVDRIGMLRDVSAYDPTDETNPLLRMAAALSFLSQSWFADIRIFSDRSYWSLPYEFWYYAMFAGAFYCRGKIRLLWVAISAAIAGPKILLYLPLWVGGVLAYKSLPRLRIGRIAATLIFFATIVGLGVIALHGVASGQGESIPGLPPEFSALDYAFGALAAVNLISASRLMVPVERGARWIKAAAGFTFSVYLYHLPLLFVIGAYIPTSLFGPLRGFLILGLTVLCIVLLGTVTEKQKHWLKLAMIHALRTIKSMQAARVGEARAVKH